tara:strand:+ start:3748 stop:5058 length:1311 start_codon:yes stop_codon:yes gene_type:complete
VKQPIKKLCDWKDPVLIVKSLVNTFGERGLIWLDGDGSELGRWITIGIDPIDEICCHVNKDKSQQCNPFKVLRNLSPGHWTGWLSYEAGAWLEPKIKWKSDSMATLWLASHDPILKFDLETCQLWLEGFDKSRIQLINNLLNKIPDRTENSKLAKIPVSSWSWLTSDNDYLKNINKVKSLISKGDIFQANLTACCTNSLPPGTSALEIFLKVRSSCPAPFGGLIIGGGLATGEAIISSSPERFLKVLNNGEVETRPIKGTRPRKKNPRKDADMAAELICSLKDRAENLMIVDLLRNDLGKVCKTGSISVPQLFGLESYSKVHHLTSVVKGNLKVDKSWLDLLEACWPGGSISGAPKIRACQRLEELEPIARGPYCGSMIKINWDGSFDSNILIRSIMLQNRTLKAHAGCGIVADSDPKREIEELKWKILPILQSLE